jgi:transcriptional regulator of acetoin/glycerol metabolism
MNVRELRTTMQRLALETREVGELRSAHLQAVLDTSGLSPQDATAPPPAATIRDEAPSRDELAALLARHHGNVSELAKHYAKDRKQIYRWLQKHGLNGDDFR